ncbi:ABC transporter permease protein [Borrelia nietonii YOR]|uniref:ABC transporter permease protein n=1 Tax=Borrelia nietonii YOR TaxID=1293576 RepID=A0ABN4C3D4_9SPIR|nr:ABC transporter permease protein [Borrelia nietonii YOR]
MFSLMRFFGLFNVDFAYNKKLYLYFVISIFLVFPLSHIFLKIYGFVNLIDLFLIDNNGLFFSFYFVLCILCQYTICLIIISRFMIRLEMCFIYLCLFLL